MHVSSLPFSSPFSLLPYFKKSPWASEFWYEWNIQWRICILLSASQGPQFDAESWQRCGQSPWKWHQCHWHWCSRGQIVSLHSPNFLLLICRLVLNTPFPKRLVKQKWNTFPPYPHIFLWQVFIEICSHSCMEKKLLWSYVEEVM